MGTVMFDSSVGSIYCYWMLLLSIINKWWLLYISRLLKFFWDLILNITSWNTSQVRRGCSWNLTYLGASRRLNIFFVFAFSYVFWQEVYLWSQNWMRGTRKDRKPSTTRLEMSSHEPTHSQAQWSIILLQYFENKQFWTKWNETQWNPTENIKNIL